MVAHLKLLIAKLKHDKYGASSERGRKLIDQLELQLGELVAAASEDAAKAEAAAGQDARSCRPDRPPRGQPVRAPLPAHLPRERVVIPGPTSCPCCGGTLSKLGEDITETLEVEPIKWKVIQTVRERFSCRSCETITQPPAPFHPIARGRAGPNLLAMILEAKFGQHLPLNRQSEAYALQGIELSVSTIADWVGACTANLAPLMALIDAHVLAAERLHGDDTTVPVLARGKTDHRPGLDLCPRRPTLWRTGTPGGDVPLLAGPNGRAPEPAPGRLRRHPAGRRLRRLQRPVRGGSNTGADHRGRVLGPWQAQAVRAGRVGARSARHRGGAADRRHL
jgi:transposase